MTSGCKKNQQAGGPAKRIGPRSFHRLPGVQHLLGDQKADAIRTLEIVGSFDPVAAGEEAELFALGLAVAIGLGGGGHHLTGLEGGGGDFARVGVGTQETPVLFLDGNLTGLFGQIDRRRDGPIHVGRAHLQHDHIPGVEAPLRQLDAEVLMVVGLVPQHDLSAIVIDLHLALGDEQQVPAEILRPCRPWQGRQQRAKGQGEQDGRRAPGSG